MTTAIEPGRMFPVTVDFASDWHIGSGHARSRDVDRSVLRDEDGLPYVPAATLVGLLRQHALDLARDLDRVTAEKSTVWTDWHRHLFGSRPTDRTEDAGHERPAPVPASLRAAPLRLTGQLR